MSVTFSLRAKGALISEPQFSTPFEMQFFPREKGKTAFSKKNPRQMPFSLSRVGNRISQGVENRGSLISAPLALRVFVRNSGAGNGCANFMGTWKNAFFLQEKTHVYKIPRLGGGGYWGFWGGGGGEVPILFLWARGFF